MSEITVATLRVCKMRNVGHFRGQGFFGDFHQCVEHPRLKRSTTYYKKTRTHEVRWLVDGQAVKDLEAAAAALNKPPQPTAAMIEALAGIGDEAADHRKRLKYDQLAALCDFGLIEWTGLGKCRRTDTGRAALHQAGILMPPF